MHGIALIICLLWQRTGIKLSTSLSGPLTFLFVCLSWVVFRARDWDSAEKIYRGLFSFSDFYLDSHTVIGAASLLPFALCGLLYLVIDAPNSNELLQKFKPTRDMLLLTLALGLLSFFMIGNYSEFLYFQF
jgi:alginate O-acetyltransferase complex protein AlgI